MKCSIFIAPSVDGYIATEDGGVHWLETVGKLFKQIKLEDAQATTFPNNFIEIKYKVKYL